MAIRFRWLSYTLCCAFAACGGGGDTGGATPKTFSSPSDGASLSATLANLFNQVSGSSPSGKALRAKVSTDCSGGGTVDVTGDNTTNYAFDGTFVFSNCVETDQASNTQVTFNGQLIAKCNDPNQDQSTCNANDAASTLGQRTTPLAVEIKNSPIDVLASFYALMVSLTDNNDQQTDSATFDGRLVVTDNTSNPCGSGDITIQTLAPLTVAQSDYSQITAGELKLSAPDGSSANVVFNADGSETVTVNGVGQTYTPAQLAALCGI